ncbi:type I-MYXAN CRISPR-associated protein Cas6/Cmx6 [Desulfovulcanus sp.]
MHSVFVNLCFKIKGDTLPVDHGFALFSNISRLLPFFHSETKVGLKLIRGRYVGNGLLSIKPVSELALRMPAPLIPEYLALTGKTLDVLGHSLDIGIPTTKPLVPATALYAHLVTTKNGHKEERFKQEIARQMQELNLEGRFILGRRRTFQVHGKQVVGYSLLISELTAEESIVLQEHGLGGRRKMGCGFFEPWRPKNGV